VFFQNATSFHCGKIAGGAQDELISLVILSLYVNDMPSPSHYAELSLLCGRHGHHSHIPQAGSVL
jgi:hypothetical protein